MIETNEGKKHCMTDGLSVYCIKLLLECDDATAAKFADFHEKHLKHKVDCIINESSLKEKDDKIDALEKEVCLLKSSIETMRNKVKEAFNV